MTPTLKQIREALAANLAALDGVQVSAYMLAKPTPPTIHLYPGEVEYQLGMGRAPLDRWTFTVQAFVGLSSDIGAQMRLDEMLAPYGNGSLRTAVEADQTLGGVANSVDAVTSTGYRAYSREGSPPVLGAEWTVQVLIGP